MDDNGAYMMYAIQMLHGVYNIQNWQETEELKELWKYVERLKVDKMQFTKLDESIIGS